jgi:excinuclease ABC subunit B
MRTKPFKLVAPFEPTGDQPKAIELLTKNVEAGIKNQVLLGVTGSGKTFTMANVIANTQKPTLVLAHNKTLAAQLFAEFREFFPENSVQYFVSYYDYYQPEAYVPRSDTYIEKEANINQEIEKFRHASTHALLTRRDVIIVASVSCIYGLGSPDTYRNANLTIRVGEVTTRADFVKKLTDIQYERNDVDLRRGRFQVKGDTILIFPAYDDFQIRVVQFGDEIESIALIDPISGDKLEDHKELEIFPAKHYLTKEEDRGDILKVMEQDMRNEVAAFEAQGKLIEAQRLRERTTYDLEMLRETGTVNGVENYSRYFDGRTPGSAPSVLLDYFPDDFLLIVDESHMTVSQVGAMYNGDKARKQTLIDYGFRLKAALDNRPLKFEEFNERIGQTIFVSATPGKYELEKVKIEAQEMRIKTNTTPNLIAEQLIRPTGIVDPTIEIRPPAGQISNLLEEIKGCVAKQERVLVTTLTKRMAEDVAEYLSEHGVKVQYLHSDIVTMERTQILQDLRLGTFDVLVGINLLREGLDLPEVSLVAILDADKEGFLRSATALMQTFGRAARHPDGRVILYADKTTGSMQFAIDESTRRRATQIAYNKEHNIVPQLMQKPITVTLPTEESQNQEEQKATYSRMNARDKAYYLEELREKMRQAALALDFEQATQLRDKIQAFLAS